MADELNPSALALSDEERDKYREVLKSVGAWRPCARCDALPEKIGVFPIRHEVMLYKLAEAIGGGTREAFIPTIVTMCTNCGLLSYHAERILNARIGDLDE